MAKFNSTDNRGGRPRGARNKLAQSVLADLLDVWNEPIKNGSTLTRGKAALQVMSIEKPHEFAKLYGALMPREFHVEAVAELGDGDIDALIEKLLNELQVEHKVEPKRLEFTPGKDFERVDE
jgi:hypothetical protein